MNLAYLLEKAHEFLALLLAHYRTIQRLELILGYFVGHQAAALRTVALEIPFRHRIGVFDNNPHIFRELPEGFQFVRNLRDNGQQHLHVLPVGLKLGVKPYGMGGSM